MICRWHHYGYPRYPWQVRMAWWRRAAAWLLWHIGDLLHLAGAVLIRVGSRSKGGKPT